MSQKPKPTPSVWLIILPALILSTLTPPLHGYSYYRPLLTACDFSGINNLFDLPPLPGADEPAFIPATEQYVNILLADCDNDGDSDLLFRARGVVTSHQYDSARYINDGLGDFTQSVDSLPMRPASIRAADFTGDGKTELPLYNPEFVPQNQSGRTLRVMLLSDSEILIDQVFEASWL